MSNSFQMKLGTAMKIPLPFVLMLLLLFTLALKSRYDDNHTNERFMNSIAMEKYILQHQLNDQVDLQLDLMTDRSLIHYAFHTR